ncbi:MAG: 1-acyl-sn-glycerol-3-phosphate acyltransferase, partial [Saprospiraceae bacterium]|nr:1-acyl-sn-glycerol-3-phosphate acyltransferase [Saprospiraceae bacterium]
MGKALSYLRFVAVIIALFFILGRLLFINGIRGKSEARGFRFRRKFTAAAKRILGLKTIIKGAVPKGTFLFVANHRSLTDPIIVLNDVDAYVVSKAEVAKYPLIGKGAEETGVIYVQRSEKSSREAAKEAIRGGLAEGKSILIYPEGTTSQEETTMPFKRGSFDVAVNAGIPVIPIAIDYKHPDNYWFNRGMITHFVDVFSRKTNPAMIW